MLKFVDLKPGNSVEDCADAHQVQGNLAEKKSMGSWLREKPDVVKT